MLIWVIVHVWSTWQATGVNHKLWWASKQIEEASPEPSGKSTALCITHCTVPSLWLLICVAVFIVTGSDGHEQPLLKWLAPLCDLITSKQHKYEESSISNKIIWKRRMQKVIFKIKCVGDNHFHFTEISAIIILLSPMCNVKHAYISQTNAT